MEENVGREDVYQAMEEPHAQLYWHREDHAGKSQPKGRGHVRTRICNKTLESFFIFNE